MSINLDEVSIVHWLPDIERHKCGYCKNERGNVSSGMWAEELTVEDYQELIDRGWRRSGNYCYKPAMSETCCPQYTIRCDATHFVLSKSQKKVLKKFNKFLIDGVLKTSNNNHRLEDEEEDISNAAAYVDYNPNKIVPDKTTTRQQLISNNNSRIFDGVAPPSNIVNVERLIIKKAETTGTNNNTTPTAIIDPSTSTGSSKKISGGADPNKPKCKKAKLIRLERKQEKLLKRGMNLDVKGPSTATHHQIDDNNAQQRNLNEFFLDQVGEKHHHKLKIKLERMSSKHESFKLSASLFKKYQMFVHNDPPSECDESQFFSFLVDTPLKPVKFAIGNTSDGGDMYFGSYHQQYWLDDKLIAVGVIDILPRCVSSVYFFYDPDYRNLTLGTYGSLREIQFTTSLHQHVPSIQHYYMGFYIHSCPKMRYKGKLVPSYLLCPETYVWCPIDKSVEKLNVSKYSRLNSDIDAIDENCCNAKDVDEIKIILNHKLILFHSCKKYFTDFCQFALLVGKKCAKTMLFVLRKT